MAVMLSELCDDLAAETIDLVAILGPFGGINLGCANAGAGLEHSRPGHPPGLLR